MIRFALRRFRFFSVSLSLCLFSSVGLLSTVSLVTDRAHLTVAALKARRRDALV